MSLEPGGLEPPTFCMPCRRAPNCAMAPGFLRVSLSPDRAHLARRISNPSKPNSDSSWKSHHRQPARRRTGNPAPRVRFPAQKPPPASAKAWRAKGDGQVHPVPALADRNSFQPDAPSAIFLTLLTPLRSVHASERTGTRLTGRQRLLHSRKSRGAFRLDPSWQGNEVPKNGEPFLETAGTVSACFANCAAIINDGFRRILAARVFAQAEACSSVWLECSSPNRDWRAFPRADDGQSDISSRQIVAS